MSSQLRELRGLAMLITGSDEERKPRVIVVVEGGSRQLIGVFDKDSDVPLHTGEVRLLNPLQFIAAPPDKTGGDGFVIIPLFPLIPVDEMLVQVTSVVELEVDSRPYRKYFMLGEAFYNQQRAAAAGLSLAHEMPRGGIVGE